MAEAAGVAETRGRRNLVADVRPKGDALRPTFAVHALAVRRDQVGLAAALAPVETIARPRPLRVPLRLGVRLLAPKTVPLPVATRPLQTVVAQAQVDAVGLGDLQVRPTPGDVGAGRVRPVRAHP